MQETVIRGKAAAFVLFLVMILLSVHFQRQQTEVLTAQPSVVDTAIQSDAPVDTLPKRVALTFDDGPHPVNTKILLDGLRERGVKATFFVIGENIAGREEIIRQMAEDGHLIGNHTYNHTDIRKMSSEEACEELKKTSDLVEEITGNTTPYVRAPFGNWDDDLDCLISMIPVKWSVDPLDWTTKNQAQIVNKVVTKAADNDIILLHDCYESSVKAALEIIDILKQRGYEFVTVEEVLLD